MCTLQARGKYTGQSRERYVAIMSSLGRYIFSNCMHVILETPCETSLCLSSCVMAVVLKMSLQYHTE